MSIIPKLSTILREFKARHGLESSEHNLAATVHLMNEHKIDKDHALDRTSHEANDHGIDGWFLSADKKKLHIYQSKFSENPAYIEKGIEDLNRAHLWLTEFLCEGKRAEGDVNACLRNLISEALPVISEISEVEFVLLSQKDSVADLKSWNAFCEEVEKGQLNRLLNYRKGGIEAIAQKHNFSKSIARMHKRYRVETFQQTQLDLREKVFLRLSYVPISSLVRLFRERGTNLFDRNVRMSLMSFSDSKNRVVHPMEDTFSKIVNGELEPEIFAFYHVGITLWAASEESDKAGLLNLESPAVVNGCQTVNIAERFFRKLEDEGDKKKIDRFNRIRVVAKIVVGSNDNELREITNSNNRQNPIAEWQLYSNDEIHHRIEAGLKDVGIFYERQKGKLDALRKETEILADYPNTNDTSISVPDLAVIIALCRGDMQKAAKYSDIFVDKKTHDSIFSEGIVRELDQAALTVNLLRAAKRALSKTFHEEERANRYRYLLDKPGTRVLFWRLSLLHGLQKMPRDLRESASKRLHRSASTALVEELVTVNSRVIGKIIPTYREHENDGRDEMAGRTKLKLFREVAVSRGLNWEQLPFRK